MEQGGILSQIIRGRMSVDEMPIEAQQGNRMQRKRAEVSNNRNSPDLIKMPRLEGHRKTVHWEVKPSQKRTKRESLGQTKVVLKD
jgi:hypothetical protein